VTAPRIPSRRPPVEVLVLGGLGLGLAGLPMLGLLIDVPWSRITSVVQSTIVTDALRVSAVVSIAAMVVVVVLGTPLAWIISQMQDRARRVVRAIVLLPMVLPPVVGGTALLATLGRQSLLGGWLHAAFGITLPFTTAGAVIAASFVSMPFFVVTVEAAIRQSDADFAEAAATLGAGQRRVFSQITLPLIAPAIGAGAALAWARALGEFGATITFNGSLGGRTQTLPLATYESIASGAQDEALVLSFVLLSISLVVLLTLRDRWITR